MKRRLSVGVETWPLKGTFTISRGSKTAVDVVVAEVSEENLTGRGESVPYARYGETVSTVVDQIQSQKDAVAAGLDREELQTVLSPGSARNALDCALWDLAAKRAGKRVWTLAGLAAPEPVETFDTLGMDTPEGMGSAARLLADWPFIKIKVDREQVIERVAAVRQAAPKARLLVDPNEGWTIEILRNVTPRLKDLGVEVIEQPLPAGKDEALAAHRSSIPICADESCHQASDLEALVGRYDIVSIKLNKTGGLTEALRLARAAKGLGMKLMISCMNSTSLAVAPATLLTGFASLVDLDGPRWLARDRAHGLRYEAGRIHPPDRELWG